MPWQIIASTFTTDRSCAPPGGMRRATGNSSGWLFEDLVERRSDCYQGASSIIPFLRMCSSHACLGDSTHHCYTLSMRPHSSMKIIRVPTIVNDLPHPSSSRLILTSTSAPLSSLPNHQTQSYVSAMSATSMASICEV